MNLSSVQRLFRASFDPKKVTEAAKASGACERVRKVKPSDLLLALLQGCCTGPERTIAGCRRAWEALTGATAGASTVEDHFHAGTVAWLWRLLQTLFQDTNRAQRRHWPKPLRALADVVLVDGTRMLLVAALADVLRGTAPDQAGLKVLGTLSLGTGTLQDVRFGAAVHHDRKLLRLTPGAGEVILPDLGFYDHDWFAEIDDADAFFVSRLKAGTKPRVEAYVTGVPRRQRVPGAVLDRTQPTGRTVDLDCAFRVHDDPTATHHTLRVVKVDVPRCDRHGVWQGDFRACWYVTNLPRDTWSADMIALLYRLRWLIERLWRRAKHLARLDHLRTARPAVIFTFMLASLLLTVMGDRLAVLLAEARGARAVSADRVVATLVAWWPRLALALRPPGRRRTADLRLFLAVLVREGRHPNPSQPPLRQVVFEALDLEADIYARLNS